MFAVTQVVYSEEYYYTLLIYFDAQQGPSSPISKALSRHGWHQIRHAFPTREDQQLPSLD